MLCRPRRHFIHIVVHVAGRVVIRRGGRTPERQGRPEPLQLCDVLTGAGAGAGAGADEPEADEDDGAAGAGAAGAAAAACAAAA